MNELVAVTGRFQPFHNDHLGLVLHALSIAKRILMAITNPDPRSLQAVESSQHRHLPSANPFSFFERTRMIAAALQATGTSSERYDIVPFPLDEPSVWPSYVPPATPQLVRVYTGWESDKAKRLEAAGYPVILLDGNPKTRISGSTIREAMAKGASWAQWVPKGAREILETIGDTELRRRCATGASSERVE